MHEVLVNRLGGLRGINPHDRPDMTLDVYCGRKTTAQQQQILKYIFFHRNKTARSHTSEQIFLHFSFSPSFLYHYHYYHYQYYNNLSYFIYLSNFTHSFYFILKPVGPVVQN